jgi:hypothetical protein
MLFSPGQILITIGIQNYIKKEIINLVKINTCLNRHLFGDWGIVCNKDKRLNDNAIRCKERVLSAYFVDNNNHTEKIKIWIITEWNRSYTTILLPEEY